MKNIIIALLLISGAQSIDLKFIQELSQADQRALELPKLTGQNEERAKEILNKQLYPNQDPAVTEKQSKYRWDQVDPHAGAYDVCPSCIGASAKVNQFEFKAPKDGFKTGDKDYDRKVPEKLGNDEFMKEMITKYATEGGKESKKPNGQFWFDRANTEKASVQVVMDYLHVNKDMAETLVCANFIPTWRYFDVNNDGHIDADRLPDFLRTLTGVHLNI